MAGIALGRDVLQEIGNWAAEQMGIDPKVVNRITLDLNCSDIVYAKVKVYWTERMADGLEDRLTRYKLVPLAAKVEDDIFMEGPLRRLVETAEAVTSDGAEPLHARVLALRRAAQKMREVVPKEDHD